MLEVSPKTKVALGRQHKVAIDKERALVPTMDGNSSLFVQEKIASAFVFFSGVPPHLRHESRTATIACGFRVGFHDLIDSHGATLGHVPEIVGAEFRFNLPADENAAMMRVRSGRFAIVIEAGIGEQLTPRSEHMQVRFKLSLAIDEAGDWFSPFQDIDLVAGRLFIWPRFNFPVGGREQRETGVNRKNDHQELTCLHSHKKAELKRLPCLSSASRRNWTIGESGESGRCLGNGAAVRPDR